MGTRSNTSGMVDDYELLKSPGEVPVLPARRGIPGWWFAAAGLIAAAAVAAYIVFGGAGTTPKQHSGAQDRVLVQQQAIRPLGADAAPVDVPPLDQTDPLVRAMVEQITSHPRIAAWLATRGLVRNFVAVVANVADGKSPAVNLPMLRPRGSFGVVERGGALFIDPRSYERYDELAAAAASIDPNGAARLYTTLKPRLEEAYRDLGFPGTPFDRTLESAIVVLLQTPVADDPVQAAARGATAYRFAAPDLEALAGAQKQLLRTGPRNTRTIQSSLRAIAIALGIPAERLPPAGT